MPVRDSRVGDLHTHSHYSDGSDSPEQLVKDAREAGLSFIALTDHNSVGGIREAIAAGERYGIEVIPGCEFQSDHGEVLGYLFDPEHPGITALNIDAHRRKEARIQRFIENLQKIGLKTDYQTLKAKTQGQVQRPHLALALVEQGFAKDTREAFDNFLVEGTPTYVDIEYDDIYKVIRTIRSAGGAPVLAHPWIEQYEREFAEIDQLIDAGLAGIEIEAGPDVKGDEERKVKEMISDICSRKGLVMTRGSDYHGPLHKANMLGRHNSEYSVVERLREKVKK